MTVAARNSPPADMATILAMLQEELEATNRENMLLTLELEQRVAERTSELAISNKKLLKEIAERIRAEAEVKELNRDLERRAELLEAADQELEAFSSSVSHDLRNPLSRVLGFATLLQESEDRLSEEKPRRYLASISAAVNKMSALIDDLLRLSYSSRAPLILAHMDLNQVVGDVIAELQDTQSTHRKVTWSCERLPTVVGDASLLRQVFVNLLSNAVKYSRRNPAPKVAVGALVKEPDKWAIFVRDNGAGFDASKAEKLFIAFQRLHSTTEFEGTGIGLAKVRRIVLRHGGKVWAESRPDHGATFYVSLPKEEKLAERAASGSN
jgi:light-regulated signal transduction histidine kinase (bacteriophytochrome)